MILLKSHEVMAFFSSIIFLRNEGTKSAFWCELLYLVASNDQQMKGLTMKFLCIRTTQLGTVSITPRTDRYKRILPPSWATKTRMWVKNTLWRISEPKWDQKNKLCDPYDALDARNSYVPHWGSLLNHLRHEKLNFERFLTQN